ncbi:MAG: helix-turn-helix domain-containing protein [Candidatus Woesearchaeota archaeon]|jgi:sugar-specific transcriptional regulator TrmB
MYTYEKFELLEQLGLSQNEIKVYFSLLELEQSSATPIVKKAKIPNSKVYPILDKLIQKGLVSFVIKNNVKYFQASDPKHLIELLEKKEAQLLEQKEEIEKLIPQIELQRKLAKQHQEATVYEGIKGVKAAFTNLLNELQNEEEYLVFTLGEELETEALRHFFRDYHKKRIEKRVKVRLIAPLKIKNTIEAHHLYPGMKVRYSTEELPTGIFIFKDKVMTLVWGEQPTAFVITSQKNAQQYQKFFEERWKENR